MITPQSSNFTTLLQERTGRQPILQAFIEGIPDVLCTELPPDQRTKTYALDFDGVDDVVDCGTNTALTQNSRFSVWGWIKPTNFSASRSIVSWFDDATGLGGEISINTSGQLRVRYSGSAGLFTIVSTTASFTAGAWNFFAVMLAGDDDTLVRGCVNATDTTDVRNTAVDNATRNNFTGGTPFYIGRGAAAGTFFLGRIGFIGFSNRAFTHTEMRRIQYRTLTRAWGNDDSQGLWDKTVGQWEVERGSGTSLVNTKSPGTHDGMISGALWRTDPPYTVTYRQVLSPAATSDQSVEPLATRTTISATELRILDTDFWFTAQLAALDLKLPRKHVTLHLGLFGLQGSEYQPVGNGLITGFSRSPGKAYSITVSDVLTEAKKRLAPLRGLLNAGINAVVTTVDVTGVSSYIWSEDESGVVGAYIKIDSEIMSVSAETASGGNLRLTVTRAALGTTAAVHSANAVVEEFWLIRTGSNPLTLALYLLLSGSGNLVGANWDNFSSSYDDLPTSSGADIDSRGAGMSPSDVAIAEIEALRDGSYSGWQFDQWWIESQEIKDFIESQLCRFTGTYLAVKPDGRVTIRSHAVPVAGDVVYTITPDQISGAPEWEVSYDDILNFVKVDAGWNPATDQYTLPYIASDTDSGTSFGTRQRDYQSKGITAAFSGATRLGSLKDLLFTRFSQPYPRITLTCGLHAILLEVGDAVRLAEMNLPDLATGTPGVHDILCQVIGRTPDYGTGKVRLVLADVSQM